MVSVSFAIEQMCLKLGIVVEVTCLMMRESIEARIGAWLRQKFKQAGVQRALEVRMLSLPVQRMLGWQVRQRRWPSLRAVSSSSHCRQCAKIGNREHGSQLFRERHINHPAIRSQRPLGRRSGLSDLWFVTRTASSISLSYGVFLGRSARDALEEKAANKLHANMFAHVQTR